MLPNTRAAGWKALPNATAGGSKALGLNLQGTQDKADGDQATYVFGLGNDAGRISTVTRNGTALAVPDAYGFGEMLELRYTFAESGNAQRQGLFLDVRTSAANSSTVRGMEVTAQSEGNINVGTLSGGTFKAIPRGESGTITNLFGLEAEITYNDADWAGTTTLGAAIRGKVSLDNGGTNTAIYGVYVDGEAIEGGVTATAAFALKSGAGLTWKYAIDVLGSVLEETNSGKNVTLMRFTGANGTAYRLVHDTDSATAVSVVTD